MKEPKVFWLSFLVGIVLVFFWTVSYLVELYHDAWVTPERRWKR